MSLTLIRPDWPAPANVGAFTTTRQGGVSSPPFDSLNLAAHVGDEPISVAQNRAALKPYLPSGANWLNQVHSSKVVLLEKDSVDLPPCDGALSQTPGVVCTVMTADCLPLLLTDSKGSFVAAVHAGWRGLAGGVIASALAHLGGNGLSDVMAWLGPAIGPKHFEVGDDVRDIFIDLSVDNQAAFKPFDQKWLCDIYRLARNQLQTQGVWRIYGGNYCTFAHSERFFSYRRDGQCGRMASCIYLRSS